MILFFKISKNLRFFFEDNLRILSFSFSGELELEKNILTQSDIILVVEKIGQNF